MKKHVFTLVLLLASIISVQAQEWFTDVCDTVGNNSGLIRALSHGPYQIYHGGNERFTFCHLMDMNSGISIMGNDHPTFRLGKKYEKLSFWVATGDYKSRLKASVLQIECDGELVYDEVVLGYEPPRFVTIDVKNVEKIKFHLEHPDLQVAMTQMQVWKEGETVVAPKLPISLPENVTKCKIPDDIVPYFTDGNIDVIGHPYPNCEEIGKSYRSKLTDQIDSFNMCRKEYYSGLAFHLVEGLFDDPKFYSYFWLEKKFDKLSFVVGPNNNKSTNSSAWIVIYGDKHKILHESIVRQTDLPRQVVVDVKGQNAIAFGVELRNCDLLGQINFAAVDITLYPKGDTSVPEEGLINPNKEKLAKLPSPCSLLKNIKPYSIRGKGGAEATQFTGKSKHITFSMGGVKFTEGIILTTGATFLGDGIDSYFAYDLGGEFDYVSFQTGMLTKRRSLQDDRIRVYADDSLVLDTLVRCIWPNQYFEVPIHKCRTLKFAKPGHATQKDCYICVADIALYRGKPVKNKLFVHDQPECPDETDLIDLCGNPYFHYVGRYLSTLTNFDFNDCFIPGGSQRNFFQMKDGSKIYKGVMLEANVPLGFEDINIMDAAMMFMVGAGSAISATDFSAYTGVSAGGGLAGGFAALNLMSRQNGGQASVVAFNTYGEYKSCTFTVANKSEYWDDVDMVMNFGQRIDHPFKLNIFADHKLVGELWLTNKMEPQTITVPLFNAQSLMFWLEPGPMRSGQFVLYDMTVSKAPCDIPAPEGYHPEPVTPDPPKSMLEQAAGLAEKALDKMNEVLGTTKQCWEVTFEQEGATQTIYGWLTEKELQDNLQEMKSDPTVSNIQYRPAEADDAQACEKLFDQAAK